MIDGKLFDLPAANNISPAVADPGNKKLRPAPPYRHDNGSAHVAQVAIQGTPLVVASDDGTFTVTTALQLTEAETDKTTTEEHVLKISGKGEKLLIVAEERG